MVERLDIDSIMKLTPQQRKAYKETLESEIAWLENKPSGLTTMTFKKPTTELEKFEMFKQRFLKSEGLEGLSYEELVEQLTSGEMRAKKHKKRIRGE